MNFSDLVSFIENDQDMQANYQPVIIKTIIEKTSDDLIFVSVKPEDIEDELEFYNKSRKVDSQIGLKVLSERKIIEGDPAKGYKIIDGETFTDEERLQIVCACNRRIYDQDIEKRHFEKQKINPLNYFLATGTGDNWKTSMKKLPVRWGARETDLMFYNAMKEGDIVLFRADKNTLGSRSESKTGEAKFFGYGILKKKEVSEEPYWKEETDGTTRWKHRTIFDPLFIAKENGEDGITVDSTSGSGLFFQKALFHITDSKAINNLMSGIVKTMPSLKYDVSSTPLDATSLEELIKKYNDDRDCFTKKRISDVEFNKMQTAFVGKYLDQKKIQAMKAEEYATGQKDSGGVIIKETFCDELEAVSKNTCRFTDQAFGVWWKQPDNELWKITSQVKTVEDAFNQIKHDLGMILSFPDESFESISESMKDMMDSSVLNNSVLTVVLFLIKPDKFLLLPGGRNGTKLGECLSLFGHTDENIKKHNMLMQEKLLEIKQQHHIMKDWSNFDFSYFVQEAVEFFNKNKRYVICKFTKETSGTIGTSYNFNQDAGSEEIQEENKIIFYDFVGEDLRFWGNGKIISVKFNESGTHNAEIGSFEGVGLTQSQEITELDEPQVSVSEQLDTELKENYELTDKPIVSIPKIIYDQIILELNEKIQDRRNEILPRPSDDAIQLAIKEINQELLIEPETIVRIIAALLSGKSVLLTGPIGCGKTALAQKIPTSVWAKQNGYFGEVVTATADWTTQDVIGGIVPKVIQDPDTKKKEVQFIIQPGHASRTARENWKDGFGKDDVRKDVDVDGRGYRGKWLVIDEFNRADIDKAFGSLFTALEYRKIGIKIPSDTKLEPDTIRIPEDYRIIGTLNTRDKNYLNQMSDALSRRFETIEIDIPEFNKSNDEIKIVIQKVYKELTKETKDQLSIESIEDLIDEKSEFWKYFVFAYEILAYVRLSNPLGTAILLQICNFMLMFNSMIDPNTDERFDLNKSLDFALLNSLLPQIEKLPPSKLTSIRQFARGRIGNDIFDKDYDSSYESKKGIDEVELLINFINKHDKKINVKKWKEFLKEKTKTERDLEEEKKPDDKKIQKSELDVWEIIREYRKIDESIKHPILKKFVSKLDDIIEQRYNGEYDDQ